MKIDDYLFNLSNSHSEPPKQFTENGRLQHNLHHRHNLSLVSKNSQPPPSHILSTTPLTLPKPLHRCYIADKNLTRAIELYQRTYPGGSRDTFKFTYKPFYLDIDAPIPGTPMRERIAQKNGDMAPGIITRLERVGRGCGITFSFAGRIGNTRDSHRLLRFAGRKGQEVPREVLGCLFRDVFEGEGDVSSREDLMRVAVKAGLDGEEVRVFLKGEKDGVEVDEMAAKARREGVRHVPFVDVNGVSVEGALDPGEFFEVIVKAREAMP
jgi:predicted DsbA family dithiol-disulfide isomerase